MKKALAAVMMSGFLLGGCGGSGGSAKWEASIPAAVPFSAGQASVITLEIKENGKPVPGLQVKAGLEMKKMDHGIVQMQFIDSGNGVYKGNAKLPMPGEWVANVTMTDGKQTNEQEVSFKVERNDAK